MSALELDVVDKSHWSRVDADGVVSFSEVSRDTWQICDSAVQYSILCDHNIPVSLSLTLTPPSRSCFVLSFEIVSNARFVELYVDTNSDYLGTIKASASLNNADEFTCVYEQRFILHRVVLKFASLKGPQAGLLRIDKFRLKTQRVASTTNSSAQLQQSHLSMKMPSFPLPLPSSTQFDISDTMELLRKVQNSLSIGGEKKKGQENGKVLEATFSDREEEERRLTIIKSSLMPAMPPSPTELSSQSSNILTQIQQPNAQDVASIRVSLLADVERLVDLKLAPITARIHALEVENETLKKMNLTLLEKQSVLSSYEHAPLSL